MQDLLVVIARLATGEDPRRKRVFGTMEFGQTGIVEMIQKGETLAPELGAIVPALLTLGRMRPARVGMAQLVLIGGGDEVNNVGHVWILQNIF